MSDFPPPPQQHQGYSNYSRATYVPNPPERPPGIYFDYISKAWNIVITEWTTWVLASLIVLGITYAVNIPLSFLGNYLAYGSLLGPGLFGAKVVEPSLTSIGITLGFTMLTVLITYPLQVGMMYMAVKRVRGMQVSVGDVFSGYARVGNIFLAYVLMLLFIVVGVCLCFIPSLYVTGALAFAPLMVLDRKMSGWEAISESYNVLKPFAWAMFALMFVASLVWLLGACVFCIGVLVSFPVFIMTLALTYHNFFPYPPEMEGYNSQIGMEPPR